jgi:alkyl sulfatase BDS1-like metallo-beta-lactamase superfamily hydrolase
VYRKPQPPKFPTQFAAASQHSHASRGFFGSTVTLTRAKLNDILLGQTTFAKELDSGSITADGNANALKELLSMLDTFKFWFNIVTPP